MSAKRKVEDENDAMALEEQTAPASPESTVSEGASASESESPSEIRANLDHVLNGRTEMSVFRCSYPLAPNPHLFITGLGTVGLPLSDRDAEGIKDTAEGETQTGRGIRSTSGGAHAWEIDQKKVVMKHPAWPDFVKQVVTDACRHLNIEQPPYCELKLEKLLLWQGAASSVVQLTEATDDSDGASENALIAAVVVLLPSGDGGGALEIHHHGVSRRIECDEESALHTSALAWFTDLRHSFEPVKSGYRLALSYRLFRTNLEQPIPPLDETQVDRVHHILRDWGTDLAQQREGTPHSIVCLLDHRYSATRLCGTILKGYDRIRLAMLLEAVTRTHEFHLGLAYTTGTECDKDAQDNDDGLRLTNLVDASGNLIQQEVLLDEVHSIPENLDIITTGQEHHDGMENKSSTGIRDAVIVIWPTANHFDMVHGGPARAFSAACELVRETERTDLRQEGMGLVTFILARAKGMSGERLAMAALHSASVRWTDCQTWIKVVQELCRDSNIPILEAEHILLAARTFGFDKIQSCIEDILNEEASYQTVLELLGDLATPEHSPSVASPPVPRDWIRGQAQERLKTIGRPDLEECRYLISAAVKHGSTQFAEEYVLPQIKVAFCEQRSKLHYAAFVSSLDFIPRRIVLSMREMLAEELVEVDFYDEDDEDDKDTDTSDFAKLWIETCVHVEAFDLVRKIVRKIAPTTAADQRKLIFKTRTCEVLLPLIASLEATILAIPSTSLHSLRDLCLYTCRSFMLYASSKQYTAAAVDFQRVILALTISDQSMVLFHEILPGIKAMDLNSEVLGALVVELHSRRQELNRHEANFQAILNKWAHRYARAIADELRRNRVLDVVRSTLDATEICAKVGAPEACRLVLEGFLEGTNTHNIAPSFIHQLRRRLQQYDIKLTSDHLVFAVRRLAVGWAQRTLGPRPSDFDVTMESLRSVIAQWTCDCGMCADVRTFVTSTGPEGRRKWTRIKPDEVSHVQNRVQRLTSASLVGIYTPPWLRSAHITEITVHRMPLLLSAIRWNYHRGQGIELLESLAADIAERRVILGPEYPRVMTMLDGQPDPGSTAPTRSGGDSEFAARGTTRRASNAIRRPRTDSFDDQTYPLAKRRRTWWMGM
ncbi:hypothetical protein C8Q76DRAFT_440021 [Earliella scabrosa]|nr:hypothetical protein C8Q76DRAFT_440021 [Earliella scabrosa]